MMKIICSLVLVTLSASSAFSQWTRVLSIPEVEIVDFAAMKDILFAASGSNVVYKSVNSGANWSEILVDSKQISICKMSTISNELYLGTVNSGIYVSHDFGNTWQKYEGISSPVTGFVKFNDHVYASTFGSGVFKFDLKSKTWIPFNNQLPINIAFNVESIVTTKNEMLISAGANGQYYRYNFNTNQWEFQYYFGFIMPGLQIQSLINDADTLYACNGNRIIRSNNSGQNWGDDKIGSRNGIDRIMYVGTEKVYTVTNLISGGTWLQHRDRKTSVGVSWSLDEHFFETGYAYRIIEFKSRLFLGRDNGLFVNEVIVSSEISIDNKEEVIVYPVPVTNGITKIESIHKIKSVSIINSTGQPVINFDSVNNNYLEMDISLNPGIYFIQCSFHQKLNITKKLIIK